MNALIVLKQALCLCTRFETKAIEDVAVPFLSPAMYSAPASKAKMLRVVFFGMDLGILDELRLCPIHLIGTYLPFTPYRAVGQSFFPLKLFPLIKKKLRTAAVHTPLVEFLSKHHIRALKSPNINAKKFRNELARLKPDLGVVANFGQILGSRLLSIPKYGFINYHPSLLPRYRGPSPLGHILLNGETRSGVTWHRITEKVDQGEILAQKDFEIEPHYTLKDLEHVCMELAVKLLPPLIVEIAEGKVKPQRQDEAFASYYPKLTKKEKEQLLSMGKIG